LQQLILGSEAAKKILIDKYCKPPMRSRILEIGCGTGSLLNFIDKDLNVEYCGYDLNPQYIDFAQKTYGDRGRFYCANTLDANMPADYFDMVLAIGIFHHLNEQESVKLVESAWKSLRARGILFTADPVLTTTQSRLERYLISRDRGQNVRTEAEYNKLVRARFVNIESRIVTGLLNIPWTVNIITGEKEYV
jgi:cyclopropane fatty-acyl-phospholipid synthase-like methyltransferase